MAFECTVALQNGKLTQLGVEKFSYRLKKDGKDILTVKLESSGGTKTEYKLSADPFIRFFADFSGRVWGIDRAAC